jgi:hypothetical protein
MAVVRMVMVVRGGIGYCLQAQIEILDLCDVSREFTSFGLCSRLERVQSVTGDEPQMSSGSVALLAESRGYLLASARMKPEPA